MWSSNLRMKTRLTILCILLVSAASSQKEEEGTSQPSSSNSCNENSSSSFKRVLAAVGQIDKRLTNIEASISLSTCLEIKSLIAKLDTIYQPGNNPLYPAVSCQEIFNYNSSVSSGRYWIEGSDGSISRRYCSMRDTCGSKTGGWMQVAALDMRKQGSVCPSGLRERVHPGQRLCGMNINGTGCSQVFFNPDVKYDRVCGKVIGYQFGSTDTFGLNFQPVNSIDIVYLDGISLTYSSNPRKHIWSFAAGLDEVGTSPPNNCPCTNINTASSATRPPSFVGNDYFCDTGSKGHWANNFLYADDPLWDGAGCGPDNTCCSLNNPPWFFKHLQSSTSDDIEMRVCSNENRFNEDVRIEQIEIYVQ